MSWCANYTLVRKDGTIAEEGRARDCFRNFYGSMNSYKEVIVYVLDKYPYPYDSNGSSRNYTDEEIREYTRLLQEIGFNIHLDEALLEITFLDKKVLAYTFRIFPEENSVLVNHFLLALIRFLYESSGAGIVKEFLELCKKEGSTSIYNRLVLALMKKGRGSGHTPLPGVQLLRMLTQKELEDKVLNKNIISYDVSNTLPQTNVRYGPPNYTNVRDGAYALFAEVIESIDELEEKYKKLCEKYML